LSDLKQDVTLRAGLLFETEILWGLKIKEYSQLRESWDTLPQSLGGRQTADVVMKRERL
jgi:hypothetical protein